MADEHTIGGLMRKRAELAGKIEYLQREMRDLVQDLDHVDATIRVFDPTADVGLSKVKQYPPRHQAFRGEMVRFVLQTLREASEPITSLEIALGVVEGRGLDKADTRTVVLFRKRVGACLFNLRKQGTVREVPREGTYKYWELAG